MKSLKIKCSDLVPTEYTTFTHLHRNLSTSKGTQNIENIELGLTRRKKNENNY